MSKYRMTDVLSQAEETLYEYLETHCEQYNNEAEDWQETFNEVANFECQDWIHEIADSCTPIYTYDILECAMEEMSLATCEPEIGPAFGGEPTAVNLIAANIYEKVCEHLYDMEQQIKRRVLDASVINDFKEKVKEIKDGNK
tara:strand:+ start:218 stop:643 length:426 start_codon:yes stop_codon:yes gene_type:complete